MGPEIVASAGCFASPAKRVIDKQSDYGVQIFAGRSAQCDRRAGQVQLRERIGHVHTFSLPLNGIRERHT